MSSNISDEGRKDLLVNISVKPNGELSDEQYSKICSDLFMIMKTSNARIMLSPYSRGNSLKEITCVFEVSSSMQSIVEESIDMAELEALCVVAISFNSIEPLNDPAHGVHISF